MGVTGREVEALWLAADGAGPEEIAESLSLTVVTVRNYLTSIVSKLNARNRLDAVRLARHRAWLS